jgi:hypothetical protein
MHDKEFGAGGNIGTIGPAVRYPNTPKFGRFAARSGYEGKRNMSAIDDIITGIDGVIEKVTETTSAASAVVHEAERALEQAGAFGVTADMLELNRVKGELESVVGLLASVGFVVDETQTTVRAMAALARS